jgi:hypothetical protein
VKKSTGGFDNGLGAILIGEHSLASFLSKKSPEGISGLFQQHRPITTFVIALTLSPLSRPCGHRAIFDVHRAWTGHRGFFVTREKFDSAGAPPATALTGWL